MSAEPAPVGVKVPTSIDAGPVREKRIAKASSYQIGLRRIPRSRASRPTPNTKGSAHRWLSQVAGAALWADVDFGGSMSVCHHPRPLTPVFGAAHASVMDALQYDG